MNGCPSHDQLRRLLEDAGDSCDQPALQSHVRTCATCQETLTELSDATDVAKWRRLLQPHQHALPLPEQRQVERFLDALKRNPPPEPETLGSPRHNVLGNYELLEQLGEGGMGTVFKARHRHMDRVVALKVLSRAITASADAVARFRREVKTVARLSHPNIVTAYDSDEVEGVHFLVMEYVEGCDLSRHVHEHGPLPVAMAVEIALEAARGLDYAHATGIIHRDVKPSNLIWSAHTQPPLADGPSADHSRESATVKILDMGLAVFDSTFHEDQVGDSGSVDSGSVVTEIGTVMGTADYMSPEQALDMTSADPRSDVYSLGCTLYFLLTGKAPYGGNSFTQRVVAHRERPVPGLRDACPGAPDRLEAVFRRMVAKQPDDRYQSMAEVIAALSPFASSEPGARKRLRPGRRLAARRIRWILSSVALLLCVGWAAVAMLALLEPDPVSSPSATSLDRTQPPEPRWSAGSAEDVIPGILFRPASLPEIDGWQVETVAPRGKVFAVDWSPDGRLLAFAGIDWQIRVYDANSLRMVQLLAGHTAEVDCVEWHPTLPKLASGAHDGTVRVWNVETGFQQDQFRHSRIRKISEVAWSPDGERLAIAGDDPGSNVYLWTPGKTADATALAGHTLPVQSVCWDPGGTRLATGGRDRMVRIWTADGRLESTSRDLGYALLSVAWHPDGTSIAVCGRDRQIQILQPDATVAGTFAGPSRGAIHLEWSQDGRRLAAGGYASNTGPSVHIWNRDGTPVSSFDAGAHVEAIAWSRDGTKLAVGGWEIRCAVWSVGGSCLKRVNNVADLILDLAWNGDGTQLAVATTQDAIRVLRDDGLQVAHLVSDSAYYPRAVDWLNDGTIVAAYLAPRGRVVFWSHGSIKREVAAIPLASTRQIALNVRRRDSLVALSDGPRIWLLTEDGQPQELSVNSEQVVLHMAWNPHDNTLASLHADGKIRAWGENGSSRELIDLGSEAQARLAWHPDGRQLSVGAGNKLWLVGSDGSDLRSTVSPYGTVTSLFWNGRGTLATTHAGNVIGLWDSSGKPQATIAGHGGVGDLELAWHPVKSRLATGGRDGLLRVWDTVSGELVWTAALLPDGHFATLNRGGQLLHGDLADIDEYLVYVIESNGTRQLLAPRQFRARAASAPASG